MKTVNSDHEGCVGVADEIYLPKFQEINRIYMNDISVANVGNCC